ncbi:kinase-like protein [Xylariaceae sp. FL0804]|nr:kinase-like protein [Xylariaceae sp. FL0804]
MDFFRRNSHVGEKIATEPSYDAGTPETANASAQKTPPSASGRPFSQHRSVRTTGSNSPPSLGSPSKDPANKPEQGLPTSRDFFENNSRKHRSHTGFSFRQTVKFTSTKNATPKRTRSLEKKKQDDLRLTRQPWAIGPEAGTGLKARRLSLSLPDDFAIDIGKLTEEFEYQHKLFGRHGRHLGKGATSKVTLMARKGFPTELYAVKEFRSKKSSETAAEYEGKIKSEYSIAKSLHHPNCIETMRLCTDHGRWNHVMEYCSEGDLFNLVSKRYLSDMLRESDRLCLFKQLCQGINYLHSHGIAHRDIKLENLLITKDSKVKITDFGVSEVFSGIHPGLREAGGQCGLQMGEVRLCKPAICGSFPYIAPEVLAKEHEYDPRPLDVWSSAVVMIYLTFNGPLWEKAEETPGPNSGGYNQLVTAWAKLDAKRAKDPAAVDKDIFPKFDAFECIVETIPLRRMLLNMLHPNPKKRITMEQVMRKPWMKSIECCQYENYDGPVKPIDAYKKNGARGSHNKIFCHNHLPPKREGGSLPPMPGKPGY